MIRANKIRFKIAIIVFVIFSAGAVMVFNNIFKIYIFSEMQGVVLNQGKPVEGAVLNREAVFTDAKTFQDSTITDAEGRFHFKPITQWSLRPMMFDTNVNQKVTVTYANNEYLGWETTKRNEHAKGELFYNPSERDKKPIECLFEITESDEKKQIVHASASIDIVIWGLCEILETGNRKIKWKK